MDDSKTTFQIWTDVHAYFWSQLESRLYCTSLQEPQCIYYRIPLQTSYLLRRILGILLGHKNVDVAAGSDLESRLRMIHLVYKILWGILDT